MIWKEVIFFYILFGILGVALEVFGFSILNFRRKKDKSLKGYSSLWMFFIYGMFYFILLLVTTYFLKYNFLIRGLIYIVLIYTLEFSSGYILKKFHALPWNYSHKHRHHLKGLICLEFAPVWFIEGLIAEMIYLYLKAHIFF